jgi:excisionase family DNA binding protein
VNNLKLGNTPVPPGVGHDNLSDWPPELKGRIAIRPKRAAELLDISIPTLYELIDLGLLDARRFGRRNTRITAQSIIKLLGNR